MPQWRRDRSDDAARYPDERLRAACAPEDVAELVRYDHHVVHVNGGAALLRSALLAPRIERTEMLFLVVEHYRGGDPRPVYDRFRLRGRLAPEGVQYVSSWVTTDLTRCYQVMECNDRELLDRWIAAWSDLVDFDVYAVITSSEAAARVMPATGG